MSQHDALRMSGRSARVHDGCRIVGLGDRRRLELQWRTIQVAFDDLMKPHGRCVERPVLVLERVGCLAVDDDGVDVELAQGRLRRVEARNVGDHELGARVLEAVLELLAHPPAIQWHAHGTDRSDGNEADAPFGIVTRRDRDTIASLDRVAIQQCESQRIGLLLNLRERESLALVHEELLVGILGEALAKEHRQVARRVLKVSERDAIDRRGADLIRLAGSNEVCQHRVWNSNRWWRWGWWGWWGWW